MTAKLYGIKNCDKVRAARRWLDQHDIDYVYHDFRDDGLDAQQIQQWLSSVEETALLNKRSTTWKQLSDEQKAQAEGDALVSLLSDNPTLIKRPVLDTGSEVHLGFSDKDYQQHFRQHAL